MGVFARLSDIIASNINALLDKAENPEYLIAQVIREMEAGLAAAKRYAATAIAAERRIDRELDHHHLQVDFWQNKAREALSRGREELARRTLVRKQEHADLVRCLETQRTEAFQTSATVRAALRALEARLAEARRKQRSILARHRAVRVRHEVNRIVGTGIPDFGAAQAKFERMENRLADMEDELAAQAELHHVTDSLELEFADLEREQAVTEELEALKRQQEEK